MGIQLKYPDIFSAAETASEHFQNRYIFWKKIEMWSIILAAAAVAISADLFHDEYDITAIFRAAAFLTALFVLLNEKRSKNRDGWYACRALAESVKSETWKYCMNVSRYGGLNEEDARESFIENLESFKNSKDVRSFLAGFDLDGEIVKESMRQFRDLDMEEKKKNYLKNRIEDQITWYSGKSRFYKVKEDRFFYYASITLLVGVIISFFQFNKILIDLSPIGLIATVSASMTGWSQTRQYERLAMSYNSVRFDLDGLKGKFSNSRTSTVNLNEMVQEAETAISREHQIWIDRK